jgi:hypothetical protein
MEVMIQVIKSESRFNGTESKRSGVDRNRG